MSFSTPLNPDVTLVSMNTLSFSAIITSAGGAGMYIVVPFDIENEFGVKRLPARATFDGEPYRGTVLRMGKKEC